MRRLLTTATAAAVLLGGTGTWAACAADTATGAPTTTVGECQPGTLRASLDENSPLQAEMNHVGTHLKVTNTGDETCTFSGYPGLALEDAGHQAVATTTIHGDTYFAEDPGNHPVILDSGADAWASLVWTHTGAGVAHAAYLQISPTGSNAHTTVPFEHDIDNGSLTVTAWSATPPSAV